MVRERDLLRWVADRAPIGDDCAVLECTPWGTLLVTTDNVIDGVHLRWDREGPEAFGYKAVARGMSDVAAMGGEPLWAVIAVCLPKGVTEEQAHGVYRGAEGAGCALVGGDTSFGPLAYVAATVFGRAHEKGPVLRSGARPSDGIFVTGPLGGSYESGRHFRFTPRVSEAKRLMDRIDISAMIDTSDGLSTDLLHILEASDTGCRLETEAIPINEGATLEGALTDGEDYELLLTARESTEGLVRIGTVTNSEALLVFSDGREEVLRARGWEHEG